MSDRRQKSIDKAFGFDKKKKKKKEKEELSPREKADRALEESKRKRKAKGAKTDLFGNPLSQLEELEKEGYDA